MRVVPTSAFLHTLKKLPKKDAEAVIIALEKFASGERAPQLNFENVRHRPGYHTIRATIKTRILLKKTSKDAFDVVAVGNHD